jgi:class 3 adenylate cyclase/tetratricopeptide (TPR) repeat protein
MPNPASSAGLAGERRIVTVLFCDLKGSTTLAESLDPEAWAELVDGAFRALRGPIERYEGTVARVMGDAILAYFGAPVAHEDDPQRAILAAFEMRRELADYQASLPAARSVDLAVRVGINTGLAVVGDSAGQGIEYTALGDAVNVAARLEAAAPIGGIVVGASTERQVRDAFEFRPLGPLELKGRAAPVLAFEALRVREGTRAAHAVPLVGRKTEIDVLREAAADVHAGVGRVVCIVGDFGLGKTRLLEELRTEWDRLGGGPWSEARAQSYGGATPYLLHRQSIFDACGVRSDDPPAVVRERVEIAFTRLGQDADAIATLGWMLGVPPEGEPPPPAELLRDRIAHTSQDLLRRRSVEGPTVVVYDDLHWGDPASVDLVGELFVVAEDTPILFLWTMRPERASAAWRLKERAARDFPHLYHELDVAPLDPASCRLLLEALLPGAHLPEALVAKVLDRAEGNPLFVEELVRAMEDQGVVRREGGAIVAGAIDDLRLPETVQGIVAARIDRLDPDSKRTLQLASVVGRTFDYDVLRSIDDAEGLDRRLLTLQRGELIRELQREPDRRFAFRHALTHEAAYESLLQRRRREVHRQVAETLEVRHQARQEEFAGIIGRHFADAADPRAVGYLRLAGDRALRVHAVDDAIANYGSALGLIATSTEVELVTAVGLGLGRAYEFKGRFDDALATYESLEAMARERGSSAMEAAGLTQRILILATPTSRNDLPMAARLLERALPLAARSGDARVQARLAWAHLGVANWTGHGDEAIIAGREAASIARDHGLRDVLALVLNDLARATLTHGRIADAKPLLDEATVLLRELGDKPMLGDALGTRALAAMGEHDVETAIAASTEARAIADEINNDWTRSFADMLGGRARAEAGDLGAGIELGESCIEYGDRAGFVIAQVGMRAEVARVYWEAGDPARAAERLAASYRLAQEKGSSLVLWSLTQGLCIALESDDPSATDGWVARIREHELGQLSYRQDLRVFATVALKLLAGDHDEAAAEARRVRNTEAGKTFNSMVGDWYWLEAEALRRGGRLPAARRVLEAGMADFGDHGMHRSRWRLARALIRSAHADGDLALADRLLHETAPSREIMAASVARYGLRDAFLADARHPLPVPVSPAERVPEFS